MIRPKISQEAIDIFSYVVDKQDRKGFAKYNETIDDAHDEEYDWSEMLLEEMVDGMKYAVKEIVRLRKELQELRQTIHNQTTLSTDTKPVYSDLDD